MVVGSIDCKQLLFYFYMYFEASPQQKCVLLRFWNTLGLTSSGSPPSGEHTCTGNSPTTLVNDKCYLLANHAITKETTCQLVMKRNTINHLGMWGVRT
jgi:hypothetical protein